MAEVIVPGEGVILLTGPTRGLGLELLRLLVLRGWPLILIGRQLERIRQELGHAHAPVALVEVEFARLSEEQVAADLESQVGTALSRIGADRVLFLNSAGTIDPIGTVGAVSACALRDAMAVNFLGPAAIAGACVRYVQQRNAALHVLNVSSGAALRPLPGWGAYCASKAAIRHFFDVMACEATGTVSVEHLDPGVLDTAMQEKIRSASAEAFPLVEQFIHLKASGQLKSSADVARQIEQRLEQWLQQ